jgi:hypothetical protein
MRASFILLLACPALLAAGCTDLGDGFLAGSSRSDCHNRVSPGSGDGSGDGGGQAVEIRDTTVYLSAVRFPVDYDWRRDTTYGASAYEIILYSDFEPVLSIPFSAECASPDLDSHHIIDGHLYTEAATRERTALGRDGETVVSFEGREIMRGIMPVGSDIYTLSESRSGDGFSFRKNGKVLFKRDGGSVFGDLADPSYRPYGALYKDLDKVCFCYRDGNGKNELYYMVQDGVETVTTLQRTWLIEDIKIHQGHPRDAEGWILWYEVEDGRVWIEDNGEVSVSGRMYWGDDGVSAIITDEDPARMSELCEGAATIFHGRERDFAVKEPDSGGVEIFCSGQSDAIFSDADSQIMSPSCAAMIGDGAFCTALTSRTGDAHRVFCGGRNQELQLHGYLSCIRAEVTVRQTN